MTRRGVSQQETSHRVENKGPKRDCDLSTATLRFKICFGPSAIAFKRSDADFDFPQRKVHDLELQVLEVA